MVKFDIDCTDVKKLITEKAVKTERFIRLILLTQWHLACLKQIHKNSREPFPTTQEQILLEHINALVKKLKPSLIRLDINDVKSIGLSLLDYKVGENANFNKFLVETLLSSYKSIEITISKKIDSKSTLVDDTWKLDIEYLKKEGEIELSQYKLDSTDNQIDSYLKARRNFNSLYTIYSTIKSLEKTIKGNEISEEVKGLALQRLFHITGEYLKDTELTPNLSSDVRQFLRERGVPVEVLCKFRDTLAHFQVLSSIEKNNDRVKQLFDGFLTIQKVIKSKLIETEDSYVRWIIEEKVKTSKIDESVVKRLIESKSTKGVKGLAKCIETIKSEDAYRNMDNESQKLVDKVYLTAKQMMSRGFIVDPAKSSEGKLSETELKSMDSITEYIIKNKVTMYDKVRNKLASSLRRDVNDLNTAHNNVVTIQEVIDHLNYKGTSSSNKNSIPNNFLSVNILEKVIMKNNRSLKQELEQYFDAESFNNNKPYVDFKDINPQYLIQLLNSEIKGTNPDKEKLIRFFKDTKERHIPPEEYERLIGGLGMHDKYIGKQKLLLYSVEWRKKKFLNLLRENPPALKTIYDRIMKGMLIDSEVYIRFAKECKHFDTPELTVANAKVRVDGINATLKSIYSTRVTEEVEVLRKLNDHHAVASQIINIYALLESGKSRKESPDLQTIRNFLSHGDPLISNTDYKYITKKLVVLKNQIIDQTNRQELTLQNIQSAIRTFSLDEHVIRITGLLCNNARSNIVRRSAGESCLRWEEIAKFDKGGAKNRDPDNIIIDSEKFIRTISREFETNVEKFSNFIDLASDSEVIGDHKNKVNMLANNHRHLNHLQRVGQASGKVMRGMMINSLMTDFAHGDIENLGKQIFDIYLNAALEKVADVVSMKGGGYILKGKAWRGKSLKFISPIISNALSAFTIYELVEQVKKLKEGDEDALVFIIGNSIDLLKDAVVTVIEITGALGYWRGALAVAGPVGLTIGTVTSIGIGTYTAVTTLTKTDVGLTGWEIGFEAGRMLLGLGLTGDTEQLFGEKELNNQAVKNAISFLKDNPHIRRYVFPSMNVENTDSCPWIKGTLFCVIVEAFKPKRVYVPYKLDNRVFLNNKVNWNIQFSRTRPDNVEGLNYFCLPVGLGEFPTGDTYYCEGAIGVEYTIDRTENNTLIYLGDGVDVVYGFRDSSNIFVFGDGNKSITGGDKDDKFIFGRKSDDAVSDSEVKGGILGGGGINTINVGELAPHYEESKGVGRYQVFANFREGILKDTSKVDLHISNINVFLGRKGGVDKVVSACSTKRVDGKGGENKNYLDSVIIPKDDACFYDIQVTVNPYTKVTNNAIRGNFLYIVNGEEGMEAYIELDPSSQSNNKFLFNYTLTDVAAIDKSEENITFTFVEEFYKREKKIDVNSSFNLTVSGDDKNINKYHLIDTTRIVIGQNNVYAVQNTEKPIDSLVKDYSFIANKSQMQVQVHSNDEFLNVGSSHWDLFTNDPNATTSHLVGGGGQNVFVIISGHEKLTRAKLPISDVVIYDFDQENKTDTLNLSEIKEQLKADIDREIKADVSKIDSDLLINLSLDDESKKEVVKIRLKGALVNKWYKKVHIAIDSTFVIEEILEDFELTPQPLILDDNSETIYVIDPTDVGEGRKIRVKKEIGDYIFARDNDALVITNFLSSSTDKNNPSSIVLNDFYYGDNQDKMQWLKIEFDDKKILLSKEIERINSAGNFTELTRAFTIDSYKPVMYAIKNQTLFEAIEENNIGEVKELIDHGVTIDARNNDGQTPLQTAAKSGNLEVVKYLVEKKHADVNVGDNFGNKPLHYAACGGSSAVVKYLLEEKHADASFGIKPLHYAAYCGNLEVVKYLVEEKHTDININDNSGIKPLHYAASGNSLNVIKYLIERKRANVSVICTVYHRTGLHYAAAGGNLESVKYLIEEKGADVNVQDYNKFMPLHFAVSNGEVEIAKYLVGKGANVKVKVELKKSLLHLAAIGYNQATALNPMAGTGAYFNLKSKFRQTPLYSAVNGQLEVVKYLVQKGLGSVNAWDIPRRTPLHYAASMSNGQVLLKYISHGNNCNVMDHIESTPSRLTTDEGRLEVVKYLVGNRSHYNAVDMLNYTPLHFAAAYGRLEVVKYFVQKGVDVNDPTVMNFTPLHLAVKFNRPEVVKYLVEKGAFTYETNSDESTPFQLAIENTCLEVVKYLVEDKGVDFNRLTLLHNAANADKLEIVKYLIEKGAKIDLEINGNTPLNILESKGHKQLADSIVKKLTERLFDAVKYDEFGEVQHLINQGVSVNVKDSGGQPLLHFAASNGKLKIVTYLIEKKQVDFNAKGDFGRTCLHVAARNGMLGVVKYLIEKKQVDFNIEDDGKSTPLLYAAGGGNLEVVKYLVEEKGANINVTNNYGITPLHNAAGSGSLEMVKYIIEEKKVNVNAKTNDGQVPLHFAARTGKLGVVKYLVEENNVNVNITNIDGDTPLHVVAVNGNLEIARYLIEEKNADVNVKNNSGDTPLHSAAIKGRLEMVKFLTEKNGVDVNAKNNNGYTPLDFAAARGYNNIVEHLELKLNEKREKPQPQKRSHHHSSRRLLATSSSNQSEIATSNTNKKSLWVNDLFGSIVKLQESSAPSEAASSNQPVMHERRKRHNDHSRHGDGIHMRTRVRHRHRRIQKRNVKYQDSHFYIDQPQIATSSGTRPSSWINGLLDWIKEKGSGLVSSMADKFAAKESEDFKSRGNHACSVRLEKMYSATIPNIPQSGKSQGVPKGNIPNASWSGWSSSWEKVTSNVTDAPEMNTIVLNNALMLGDLAVRLVNGTRHKQPIHENLLSLREKSMRFIDENMIMRTIQRGKEKFGGFDTNMDV